MDSLADLWIRSGKNADRLYQGSTQQIVQELKAWVDRRKALNDIAMKVSWDVFRVADSLQQLSIQPGRTQGEQLPGMMDQISAITAEQVKNAHCSRGLEEKKNRETLLGNFFLASLKHRGLRWPQIPRTERTQTDAGVCAFLETMVEGFNAQMELEILEDNIRITQWQAELSRRDAIRAQEVANDPIPGVNTHPIGSIGARFRQEIANDPTKSTMQALTDAADGIMFPGALEFVMGRNPTRTTRTTGEATLAMGKNDSTTDDTAVYTADMLGNITVSSGEKNPAIDDTVVYIADALGNINRATTSSSGNAVDTPGGTKVAAGSSSSTATEAGAKDQIRPGAEDHGEDSKMSKAKKKREGRKRAKAAQAKKAAVTAGDSVGNDDDDGDGGVPGLVDI